MTSLAAVVEDALGGLRRAFPDASLSVDPDGAGGAFAMLEEVDLGPSYAPTTSWYGFHLSPMLPDADVYPLYLRGDVLRVDGQPHSDPAIQSLVWRDRPALQLSRRSNRRDPLIDTPSVKAVNVLAWFQGL